MASSASPFGRHPVRDFFIHPASAALIGAVAVTASLAAGGASLLMLTAAFAGLSVFQAYRTDMAAMIAKHNADKMLPDDHPVVRVTNEIARRAGLKNPPRCMALDNPRAAAAGVLFAGALGTPKSSLILVSPHIDKSMTASELEAVLAHEITHIRNSDTTHAMLRRGFGQMTVMSGWYLALTGFMAAMGPYAAPAWGAVGAVGSAFISTVLIDAAVSRAMERRADQGSAALTRNPWALSSALGRFVELQLGALRKMNKPRPGPLQQSLFSLIRSHPKTSSRREELAKMGEELIRRDPNAALVKKHTEAESAAFDAGIKPTPAPHPLGIPLIARSKPVDDDNIRKVFSAAPLPFNRAAAPEQDNDPRAAFTPEQAEAKAPGPSQRLG